MENDKTNLLHTEARDSVFDVRLGRVTVANAPKPA